MDREDIEKLQVDIRRQRDEAEVTAERARESLVKQASGLTHLEDLDPDLIRAAADDFAGAIERLRLLTAFGRALRGLLS